MSSELLAFSELIDEQFDIDDPVQEENLMEIVVQLLGT